MKHKRIPEKLYEQIMENMPICCVDVVVYRERSGKREVLVTERKNDPGKGAWGVQGGRVYKNETIVNAALRKAKEEVGLDIETEKMIGVYETMYDKGTFPNLKTGVHTINVCYLARCIDENPVVELDGTLSDCKWIEKAEKFLHPYHRKLIEDSGVFD